MADNVKNFMVEDARILFRNFSGEESQYNRAGDRNFALILENDVAARMLQDGWNVKVLPGREEGDPDVSYIQVTVNFKNRPPNVVLITSTSRTNLKDDTVGILDWANIQTCDLIARGYDWNVGDKSGTKAYLQTMFVTIEEDALERKYAVQGEM